MKTTLNHWLHGTRLYVAVAIGLITLNTYWWASVSFSSPKLVTIRLEESYAWFGLASLLIALSLGPLYRLFELPGRKPVMESRRMFGIGAAWFSSLHALIAYIGLFHLANPIVLPSEYRNSFLFGAIAWLILLAMAFTSFNAALRTMGVWWFRLHRFVYVALAAIIAHAVTIGSHASRPSVVLVIGLLTSTLLVLHGFSVAVQGRRASTAQLAGLLASSAALAIIFSYAVAQHNLRTPLTSFAGGSNAQNY